MSTLPSATDIRKLPILGIAVLAARNASRIYSLGYRSSCFEHVIELTAQVARGEPKPPVSLCKIVNGLAEQPGATLPNLTARCVADVIEGSRAINNAKQLADSMESYDRTVAVGSLASHNSRAMVLYDSAAAHAHLALLAAHELVDGQSRPALTTATQNDINLFTAVLAKRKKLEELSLKDPLFRTGDKPADGSCEVSEEGPLGPLWPLSAKLAKTLEPTPTKGDTVEHPRERIRIVLNASMSADTEHVVEALVNLYGALNDMNVALGGPGLEIDGGDLRILRPVFHGVPQ